MKKYLIITIHDVYINSYSEGEKGHVNTYDRKAILYAYSPREAIEKYFKDSLYYSFEYKNALIRHEEFGETKDKNTLDYSVLVDNHNNEATETDIELWKNDTIQLYVNNIYLTIEEIVKVEL